MTQRARPAITAHKALEHNADHNEGDADRQQALRAGKIGPGILVHRGIFFVLGAILRPDNHAVTDAKGAPLGFVDKINAKINLRGVGGIAPIGGERRKRFKAALGGELIDRGYGAARAGPRVAQVDIVDRQPKPAILGKRRASTHD